MVGQLPITSLGFIRRMMLSIERGLTAFRPFFPSESCKESGFQLPYQPVMGCLLLTAVTVTAKSYSRRTSETLLNRTFCPGLRVGAFSVPRRESSLVILLFKRFFLEGLLNNFSPIDRRHYSFN